LAGGKPGNAGARGMICKKALDSVHEYVADMMGSAILAMNVNDLPVNVPGMGTLTIKPPRVTEASYGKTEYKMIPPNKIQSRLFDGHIAAKGVWQYKPNNGELMGGTYTAVVQGTEINATNQFERTSDAKPSLKPSGCVANISNFRIEVRGHSEIQVIEDCDFAVCKQIQKYFEDSICKLFEGFVKEVVNAELRHVPTRMHINGDQFLVDYGLQMNEPTVNDTTNCIDSGMEGRYVWRNSYGVPFNPWSMEWADHSRMYSLALSDYTFNSLLHQAHHGGYRFSASDLQSPSMQQVLSLNCDGTAPTPSTSQPSKSTVNPSTASTPAARRNRGPPASRNNFLSARYYGGGRGQMRCLGSLFSNQTNFGPYHGTDTGDIVYKSARPGTIHIDWEKKGFYDGSSGSLEFYGPANQGGNRPLLARADVRLMRGEFIPKLNKANITGTVKITTLELAQPMYLRMSSEWLINAAEFAKPIITESVNIFLERYGQFPAPLPRKYECKSPSLNIFPRTIQLDCDVQRAEVHDGSESSESSEESSCRCFSGTCACRRP
jgi:hypothetical protein